MSEGLAVPSEDEASRGVLVEAVGERRRPRQAIAQVVEPVFEAGAALRPAMHRQAGGLVEHQHQAVAVKHAAKHCFRTHLLRAHLFRLMSLSGIMKRVSRRPP